MLKKYPTVKQKVHQQITKLFSNFFYRDYIKRGLDIIISIFLIIILAIPMLIIALIIKIESPNGPILFRQQRVGIDNSRFMIFKFRSMETSAPHQIATEDFINANTYITKVGKILRKYSLDELPQLFNVLKGDMSLIGPRPLIPKEQDVLQKRAELGANKVLPGITGLAQVHGRDNLVGEQKAVVDSIYAEKVSFCLDIIIFFKTIWDVVRSNGVNDD